jgi:hypothetical protein
MFAATVHWTRGRQWVGKAGGDGFFYHLGALLGCGASWHGAAEAIENGGEHGETTKKPVFYCVLSFICICCLRVTKQQYSTIHDVWPQAFWISPGTLKFLPKHWEHSMDQTWWGSTPICQQFKGKLLCK